MARNPFRMGEGPGLVSPGQQNPNADGMPVPIGVPAGNIKPSQPRAAAANRRIVLPGADFPPAGAIPVDVMGDADLGTGAAAVMVTVPIPSTYTFRIAGIGFGADDESALRFLTWSILATPPGIAVPGYVNQPAAIGSIAQLAWLFVLRGSNEVITVRGVNANLIGSLTYHYVCRLQGWFYNEQETT